MSLTRYMYVPKEGVREEGHLGVPFLTLYTLPKREASVLVPSRECITSLGTSDHDIPYSVSRDAWCNVPTE